MGGLHHARSVTGPEPRFLVGPAGGSDAFGAESVRGALEVIRRHYPEAVANDREGNPGSCDADTTPGIPVLVWASGEDSLDDDGRRTPGCPARLGNPRRSRALWGL